MIPLVSVITLTTPKRRLVFGDRITSLIQLQSYPAIEHIIIDGAGRIGHKRNVGCNEANGEIIIMCDDDDYYAPDFISRSVEHLLSTKADVTGMDSLYFYQPHVNMWEYNWDGAQKYVVESGMCFWKRVWDKNKFDELNPFGEGMKFLTNAGDINPHNYKEGMLAIIHHSNTSSKYHLSTMSRVNPSLAIKILGDNYNNFSL